METSGDSIKEELGVKRGNIRIRETIVDAAVPLEHTTTPATTLSEITKSPQPSESRKTSIEEAAIRSSSREPTQNAQYTLVAGQLNSSHEASSTLSISKPIITIQAVPRNASRTLSESVTRPALLAAGGARIDSDPLPGVNQKAPSLGSAMPYITATTALPENSQQRPAMDMTAPTTSVGVNEPKATSTPTGPADTYLTQVPSNFTNIFEAARSSYAASSTSVSSSLSILSYSQTSFLTLTRTAPEREQASLVLNTATPSPVNSLPPSVSMIMSSSIVTTSMTAIPTSLLAAADSRIKQSSRLPPATRALFIILVVLGVMALLIAFGVVMIMRKRKSRRQTHKSWLPDSNNETYKETPSISVIHNPFLTENEKAFVLRATSRNNESNENFTTTAYNFPNAFNPFIAQSRQTTNKISP
ncbi:hypothetical protein GQ44DRAFT_771398 [Phaeosphaeriaceae sp. PMI808]|nr:hypothetical protein GQ44DRAFT_771398 [Phaeosphaeriaceae sp. PMI808]